MFAMRRPSGVMGVRVGGIRSRRVREHGLHARRVHARGTCVRWPALREHRGREIFPTYLERERPVICRHEAGGNERTQRKRDQHDAGHEHLPATLASDQAPVRHEVVLGPVILAQSGRTAEHWIHPRKRSYQCPLSRLGTAAFGGYRCRLRVDSGNSGDTGSRPAPSGRVRSGAGIQRVPVGFPVADYHSGLLRARRGSCAAALVERSARSSG